MNQSRGLCALILGLGWALGASVSAQTPPVAPAATLSQVPAAAPSSGTASKQKGAAPAEQSHTDHAAATSKSRATSSADRLELGTTEISGNRELPKVLYVVPWRRPEIGDALGRPPNSLVDEVLSPVDRPVFQRQNRYFAALAAGTAPAKSQPQPSVGHSPAAAQ